MMDRQAPLRIMLIEDRTVAAITLECLLEDQGHQVTAFAATPVQAERVLRAAAPKLDLVILDALLIGLPSLGVAERLEQLDLPFVVTSTQPEAEVRKLGFSAPYLAQPFSDVKVRQAIGATRPCENVSAA